MEELLSVNPLSSLEELHLMAQYRRGRHKLVKSAADFILEKLPNLKHLGSFQFWNMSK